MPVGGGARGDTEGVYVVGGINSEIARLMKILLRNLKLGRGKHTTQMKRVKYSCVRKERIGRSRIQKMYACSCIFLSKVRLVY